MSHHVLKVVFRRQHGGLSMNDVSRLRGANDGFELHGGAATLDDFKGDEVALAKKISAFGFVDRVVVTHVAETECGTYRGGYEIETDG